MSVSDFRRGCASAALTSRLEPKVIFRGQGSPVGGQYLGCDVIHTILSKTDENSKVLT